MVQKMFRKGFSQKLYVMISAWIWTSSSRPPTSKGPGVCRASPTRYSRRLAEADLELDVLVNSPDEIRKDQEKCEKIAHKARSSGFSRSELRIVERVQKA